MSAPPIGMINRKPIKKETANSIQNKFEDWVEQSKYIKIIIETSINAFSGCCPLKVIGDPDIIPWSFKKAIIEPENVIAPTAAPIDISIKLPSLIFPADPRLKASGFKNAEIATNTAARPTRLWKPATSSGIAVMGILYAIIAPIIPPIERNIKTNTKPFEKFPIDKNVTVIAIIIPKIPKKVPCLEVSGDDKPLNARINKTPEIK